MQITLKEIQRRLKKFFAGQITLNLLTLQVNNAALNRTIFEHNMESYVPVFQLIYLASVVSLCFFAFNALLGVANAAL